MSQYIKNSIPTGKTGWKVSIILVLLLFVCQAIAIDTPCNRQTQSATYEIHAVRNHEATTNLILSLNPSTLLIPALVNATIERSGLLQLTQGQDTFATAHSNKSTYSVLISSSDYLSREMSNAMDVFSSSSTQPTKTVSMENTYTTSGANALFSWTTPTDTPTPHISPTATGGDTTASQPKSGISTKEKVVIGVGLFLFLVIMLITAVFFCGLKMRPTAVNWRTEGHELHAMGP